MRLHERLERIAKLAEAMGLPGAARQIRDCVRASEDGEIRFFKARVPANSGVMWQIKWGWRGERLESGEFVWRVPDAIIVGPEF